MDLQKGDIVKLSNTRWKCNSKGTWLVEKTPYEAGWNEDGYVLIRIKRDGGVYQDSIVIIDNLNEHYIKVDKVKGNQYMKSGAIAYFRWVADVYKRRITQNVSSKQDTFNECQHIIDLNLQTVERLCKVA